MGKQGTRPVLDRVQPTAIGSPPDSFRLREMASVPDSASVPSAERERGIEKTDELRRLKNAIAVGTPITGRPPGHRRRSPASGSHRTWRADFPHHALRSLFHSFRCYLLKFRFHGRLIFSLNRRPCLPLYGAHVAQEQSNHR